MTSVPAGLTLRSMLSQSLREILFLEFWWHTKGLLFMMDWSMKSVRRAAHTTGFILWTQNLFVPMYADTSLVGRLVSFGVRFVMVLFRGAATFLWMIAVCLLFLIYLILFPLSVIGIVFGIYGTYFA